MITLIKDRKVSIEGKNVGRFLPRQVVKKVRKRSGTVILANTIIRAFIPYFLLDLLEVIRTQT